VASKEVVDAELARLACEAEGLAGEALEKNRARRRELAGIGEAK
jgi:hypothetical protein